MSEDNIEIVRRAHAAFNRADFDVLQEVTATDVRWGTTGAWPGIDALYVGPDAVVRWAQDIRAAWDVFDVAIDAVLAEIADAVVVVERLNGRGSESGVEVSYRVFTAYWFRGGQILERKSFLDKAAALEAVGLQE